jgi:hypothetical protein
MQRLYTVPPSSQNITSLLFVKHRFRHLHHPYKEAP